MADGRPDTVTRDHASSGGRHSSLKELPHELTEQEVAVVVREVPKEPPPIHHGAPKARLESWIIALVFGVIYGVIGYFFLTDGRIASFDSLNRLNEAYMVWWNAPPKLSAITLDSAPLGALAYLPLTLLRPLATSLIAMPVLTAIAAGTLMALLNSLLRRCEIQTGIRIVLLALFGLNPMFVFYAGNGEPVMLGLVVAAVGLMSLISWRISGETRHLVASGLAISVAIMFDYGYALWAVGFLIAIAMIGSGNKSSTERLRSSMILFLTPIIYALMVWILLNAVILGSPFGWVTAQSGVIQVNTTGVLQAVGSSPMGALSDLFKVVLGIAPLGFATLVLLIVLGALKRDLLSFGFLFLILVAIAVPVIRVLVTDQADLMDLSVGLPLALLAFAGAAYAHQAEGDWRMGIAVLMGIGLIAAIPLGWNAMQDYRFQNQAQAFTRWVDTRDSQEDSKSIGGYTVGLDPELAMARYINNELPQAKNSILVDENYSYGVMITSGRPQIFLDRADEGQQNWSSAREIPYGKVDYILVTTSRAGDQLRKAYPKSVEGGEPGMTPVFRTGRYVLVQVSATKPAPSAGAGSGRTSEPQSTPRPFTPGRPTSPQDEGSFGQPATGTSGTGTGGSSGNGDSSAGSGGSATDGSSATGGSSAPALEGE